MRLSKRLLLLLTFSLAFAFAVPLVANAAWSETSTIEHYSVTSGERSWTATVNAVFAGGRISTDASGSVYMCTDQGFDVYGASGRFVRSVAIRGGWGAFDVCVAPNKQVYVADAFFGRIQRYSRTGKYLGQFGKFGNTKGRFDWPTAIASDSKSNIYVADETGRIQKFSSTGKYIRTMAGRGSKSGKFKRAPKAIAVDASGILFAVEGAYESEDPSPDRVQRFSTTTGKYLSKWSVGGNDIAIDKKGNVFISPDDGKTTAPCVRRFSRSGKLLQTYLGAWSNIDVGIGGMPWSIGVDNKGGFLAVSYGAG